MGMMGYRSEDGPRAGTRTCNAETGVQAAVVDPPEGTVWDIHVWQPMRKSARWACDVCGHTRRPFGPSPHPGYYSLMGRPILSSGPLDGGPSVGPGLGGLGGALAPVAHVSSIQPSIAPPVDATEQARLSLAEELYAPLRSALRQEFRR